MKKNVKRVLSFLLVLTLLLSVLVFSGCSSSNERDVNECGVCGTKYYAGDAGGNYMKIAYSGMCKSCYETYKAYQEIKDYYELN